MTKNTYCNIVNLIFHGCLYFALNNNTLTIVPKFSYRTTIVRPAIHLSHNKQKHSEMKKMISVQQGISILHQLRKNTRKMWNTTIAKYAKTFAKSEKQKVYSGVFCVTFFAFHARLGIHMKSQRILYGI